MAQKITVNAFGVNVAAAIDTLAHFEGTSTSTLSHCGGYDLIVGGKPPDKGIETFEGWARHPFEPSPEFPHGRPGKFIGIFNDQPVHSTASGLLQITLPTWRGLNRIHQLGDFSPSSQELGGVELIRECVDHSASGNKNALLLIQSGHFEEAIPLLSKTWASLPGSAAGQRNANSPATEIVVEKYYEFLATYTASKAKT